MNLKNHVRHAVLAVALASSVATAIGAAGAVQADNEIPVDSPETTMASDQPAEEAPPGTDASTPENPPATDDGTAAPTTTTPPATDPTTPPTTDAAEPTVPAQSGRVPVTTTASAIATVTAAITVPSAPLSPVASPGNHAVSLSWQAPANTGGAAVGYVVEYTTNPAGQWHFVAAPKTRYYTVSSGNLYNGTKYYFRIRAQNAVGTSPASTVVSAVPRTKPSVVPFCKATQSSPGSYWIVVNWSPPSNNGGAPIQEYTIELYVNGHYLESHWEAGTTTYNAYKMPYYFNDFEVKVYARNAAGYSPACFVDHVSVLP
jgi:hypothetical protein